MIIYQKKCKANYFTPIKSFILPCIAFLSVVMKLYYFTLKIEYMAIIAILALL